MKTDIRSTMLDGCTVLPPMEPAEPTSVEKKPNRKRKYRKTRDRFATLNAFVDTVAGDLTRSELLVWMVLYRDTRNGCAATSQDDMARRAKLTSRTVRYALSRLKKRGLVTVVYQGGINRGTSKYRVSSELSLDKQRQ